MAPTSAFHRSAGSTPTTRAEVEAVRALARVARLLERAAGDLGMAQYRVLEAIASGDERASRVAERLGLGRPAISAAVEALCRDGLLRRADVPGDQRGVNLALTPAGRKLLHEAEERMVAVLSDVCARSGEPVAAQVLASLAPAVDELQREGHARRRAAAAQPQSTTEPRGTAPPRDVIRP